MTTFIKRSQNFLACFAASMLTLAPVWADDTEIFFADVSEGEISPNILFIVDTSGSMRNEVPGTNKSRLQNVQEAMEELLNNLFDVNVGLMRFSNPGGPVLYQIDYIDRNVNETEAGIIDEEVLVSAGNDDAQQVTNTGQVIVDSNRLKMNIVRVGEAADPTFDLNYDSEDAEERSNGCMRTGSEDLEIVRDNSAYQSVGLRFSGLDIPDNATITNAYVTFTVDNPRDGGLAEIDISAELKDSGTFSGDFYCPYYDDPSFGITKRTRTSDTRVPWDINETVAGDQQVVNPSLTSIVQEAVDHEDWTGVKGSDTNAIVLIFERREDSDSSGEYDFLARDESTSKAADLTVEYYVGSPPGDYPGLTGNCFQEVFVPKGVTITNATLEFTSALADAGEASDFTIYGEDDDNPAEYDPDILNDISSRTKTSASVNWSPSSWDAVNVQHTTPNLQSIVQEIVSRDDWCGGDDMAFVIEGEGLRSAHAFENGVGQPKLLIQYEEDSVEPGESCMLQTVSRPISDTNDDVEEDDGDVSRNGDILNMIGSNTAGLRFTEINLPEDIPILDAWLEFEAHDDYDGNSNIAIMVQQTGDAEPFVNESGTVADRTWSSAITWNITEDWSDSVTYRSPSIKTLVQSIVDRNDWTLGNDMAFMLDYTGGGNERGLKTRNQTSTNPPKLVVQFEDDGTETDIRLVRDELIDVMYSLNNEGWTPIQDTLYEAALYYRGENVKYGKKRGGGEGESGPHAYTRVSVNESMVAGTYANNRPSGCTVEDLGNGDCAGETITGVGGEPQYKTPIDDFCQKSNHIILLTDGSANRPHSTDEIETMTGKNSCIASFEDSGGATVNVDPNEACVLDLVSFLNSSDQSALKETQTVTTHTIGFNFSSPWLEAVADYGGGTYKEATNASDLVDEVEAILEEVLEIDSTFVAPVATINQFNRLNHRQEIYFAVFRPTDTPNWPGNIKKYRLGEDNAIFDYDGTDGKEAVSASSGFFKDTAVSGWGGVTDGTVVEKSGAFSKMPVFSTRKLFVSYSGMTSDDLSDSTNALSTSNTKLTKAMFGVNAMSDEEFTQHLLWVQGRDVDETFPGDLPDGVPNNITNENRYIIGDPLHSKPVAITYGGTEESPDISVFFGTNAGFLHALNAETGVEQFAFLPEEMMPLQQTLREQSNSVEHAYGIDGNITPWVYDKDNDGNIEEVEGDFVRIIFGQRRGGRNYWALDVTDRTKPRLLWQIKGGQGDFVELGQSWSTPIIGTIDINGTEKDVIYFSAGYDEDQDDISLRKADDVGRAIYIVDAETGELIWSGGPDNSYTETYTDMKYSFPAGLAVVDVTNSGTDNMFFIGDVGGQVWRFDINNGASDVDDLITGGVIADVGVGAGINSAANNRRFYHRPDVALYFDGTSSKLAVTIGSGYRASPLSTGTQDRFYMIRQDDVFTIPQSYTKIVESDLYDATDNNVGENIEGAEELLAAAKGWYFNMPRAGEKILSIPLTFKNTVVFTSYEPSPNAVTSNCVPSAGVSRVYQINLADASPVNNWDDVKEWSEDDRSRTLQTTSVVDEPVIICTGAGCDLKVGLEEPPIDTLLSERVVKTFWRKDQ